MQQLNRPLTNILGKIQKMLVSQSTSLVGATIFQVPMTSTDIKTCKVSHPKMLLLDKATSALDSESACIVQQ
nr:hypothetical protein [Tanacetum cinerariifolium]